MQRLKLERCVIHTFSWHSHRTAPENSHNAFLSPENYDNRFLLTGKFFVYFLGGQSYCSRVLRLMSLDTTYGTLGTMCCRNAPLPRHQLSACFLASCTQAVGENMMKYTVSVFLIATVLLASTRAAPVPLSDDLLLDDDYLEDVVGSVVPEVDVDLSSDSDRGKYQYCEPWPVCSTDYSGSGYTGSGDAPVQQHGNTGSCALCFELIGGECRPKVCAPGKVCALVSNKKKWTTAGMCG
jgi:hypothetical protein